MGRSPPIFTRTYRELGLPPTAAAKRHLLATLESFQAIEIIEYSLTEGDM
jgi:hypothetical protein